MRAPDPPRPMRARFVLGLAISLAACPAYLLPLTGAAAQSGRAGSRAPSPTERSAPGASDAFWEAVERDDVNRVQTLLLRGIDTNAVHPEFGPAIVVAAREGSWNVVRALAGIVGTRIDAPNAKGETTTMLAALHGNLDIVQLLVEKGAEVNRPGWAPLHYAAVSGRVELLQFLLDRHAYIDAQSPNRSTPLMMAARHDRIDAVRLLVAAGADPTPRNDSGLDAADYLARNGNPEEARWMREQAALFARKYATPEGETPARSGTNESAGTERSAARGPEEAPRLPGARGSSDRVGNRR